MLPPPAAGSVTGHSAAAAAAAAVTDDDTDDTDGCAKSADSPVDVSGDAGGDTAAAMARLRGLDEELEAAERAAFSAASKRLAETSAMHRRLREAEATQDQHRLARLQQARRGEAPTTPQLEDVRAAQAALRAFMDKITASEGATVGRGAGAVASAASGLAMSGELITRSKHSMATRGPHTSAVGLLPADVDGASVRTTGSRRSGGALSTPSLTIRGPSVSFALPSSGAGAVSAVRGASSSRDAALSLCSAPVDARGLHPLLGASGTLRWRSGARSDDETRATTAAASAEPRPAGDTAVRMGLADDDAARLQQLLLDDDDCSDGDDSSDGGARAAEGKLDDVAAPVAHDDGKLGDAVDSTPPRKSTSTHGSRLGRRGVEEDFGATSLDLER